MPEALLKLPLAIFGTGVSVQATDLDGTLAPAVKTVMANYQITASDYFVIVNTAGGNVTITLPPAAQIAPFSRQVRIMKLTRVNVLTIVPAAGDFIFGGIASEPLYNQYSIIELASDGGNHWYPTPTHFMASDQSTTTVTGAYIVQDGDYKILADATAGAFQINLPQAQSFAQGHEFRFEKIDSSANAVTIAAFAGDMIEGASTVVLGSQYATSRLTSNGASPSGIWYKL